MIGNRHIPISNFVNAALLSRGDCCMAVDCGNGLSTVPAGMPEDVGGAEKGESLSDTGSVVMVCGMRLISREVLRTLVIYFAFQQD